MPRAPETLALRPLQVPRSWGPPGLWSLWGLCAGCGWGPVGLAALSCSAHSWGHPPTHSLGASASWPLSRDFRGLGKGQSPNL